MRTYDCIIRGGTLIRHDGRQRADIGIAGGVISMVGDLSQATARREIHAKDKIVIPGGIDPHTHLDSEYAGLRGGDTVHSGTLAAAYGGTTCLIDFAAGAEGLRQRVENRRAFFEGQQPVIDFGFHCVAGFSDGEKLGQVRDLIPAGVSSVKYYMNNSDPMSDGVLLQLLEQAGQEGILVCVHAENQQIMQYHTARLVREGRVRWRDFPLSKPAICEHEAVLRAMALARAAGTGVYIVHVSSGQSALYLRQAREGGGPFYGETCAHYLTLTEEAFGRKQGELYKVAPPLRSVQDSAILWDALADGTLQALGSDHVSYTKEEKRRKLERDATGEFLQDFTKVPDGLPGIQLRLPTLVNGVLEGRLSWETLVRINAYEPARLFGLYPAKGEIACGFDADIVILDPESSLKVRGSEDLHMNCDHTPFAGLTYRCLPRTVLVRGHGVIENGMHTGMAVGRYVSRRMERALLKNNRAL